MNAVREPAVAGLFYPSDPQELRAKVRSMLTAGPSDAPAPKALIAPHAGYIYSGPVAATAYARLASARRTVKRVVLLGPAHFYPVEGLAASSAEAFRTPLGTVPVDREAQEAALRLPFVRVVDAAHAREHSLEVQLPFLQEALDTFALAPLLVGEASPEEVGEVLETLWGGPETLVVISSDLSHYHDYATARALDRRTADAIVALRPEEIEREQACGRTPINGLLWAARRHGLRLSTLDLRSSGDTAGPRDRVVGYGAFVTE